MEIFFRDRRERYFKKPSQGYAYHLSPSPVATNALLITATALFDLRPQSPVLPWTPQGRIFVVFLYGYWFFIDVYCPSFR